MAAPLPIHFRFGLALTEKALKFSRDREKVA